MLIALAEEQTNVGSVRETFFLSQIKTLYKVQFPQQGDFIVKGKYTSEVGGRGKSFKKLNLYKMLGL